MFKRFISALIAAAMCFAVVGQVNLVPTCVYAFNNYQVSANKDTTIRKECSKDAKIVKNIKKGTKLTVIGEVTNKWGNVWYKVSEGYVFSGNFTKVAGSSAKKVITRNVNFNVYALEDTTVRREYYDKTDIIRYVKKNEIMSVTQEISNKYGNIWYKVRDGYIYSGKVAITTKPVLEPSYTPPTPSTPSTIVPKEQERVESQPNTTVNKVNPAVEKKQNVQPTHTHDYKRVGFEDKHPHYALYECTSCDSGYCLTSETKNMSWCEICNPKTCGDNHDFVVVGYEEEHPHYLLYQCTRCEAGYCSNTETHFVSTCFECTPQICKDDEDGHMCVYNINGGRLKEHPHYRIKVCECGNEQIDKTDTGYYEKCSTCQNVFTGGNYDYSDFYGRIIDLQNGRLVTLTSAQQDAVRDFAADHHYSLDLFGMLPVVGAVFDATNIACYLVEGRYSEALISGAAFIPFVGILTTEGKIISREGTMLMDAATESIDNIPIKNVKSIKYITMEGFENLSDTAATILKNTDNYSDSVLLSIKKITEGRNMHISDVFYGNSLLIHSGYKGKVTSYAGLVYDAGGKEGNRLVHVAQHAANSSAQGKTLFNKSGKELFSMIDDVFYNGDILKIKENGIRTEYYIDAGYVIGKNGQTVMEIVLENDRVITAYPIKGI